MKHALLPLLLFLGFSLVAQSTSSSEVETDTRYEFSIRVDRSQVQALVDAFTEVAETDVNRKFRGDWTRMTDDEIEIYLNTRRRRLTIYYRGEDIQALRQARAKGRIVKSYFGKGKKPERMTTPDADFSFWETGEADRFALMVYLENGSTSQLMRCANEVTGNNINVRMKGNLTTDLAEGATLSVDTYERTLLLQYEGSNPTIREKIRETAGRLRSCFGLPAKAN